MNHMEKARELRASTDVHYNCAQSVLVTFAKEMGLTEQQAYDLGSHFGSGIWASTTAASISTQPKYSLPLIWSPRITAPASTANTDSRLSSRETTVGLEPF